ncbi:MAG: hypothetical protein EXR55_00010 [Dehalococcoidia bacterium]|nr:hypothetical protein [Dehalococcoidia bacterium]
MIVLVAVLLLGAGLGGAFASGLALGKSQGSAAARSTLSAPSTSGSGQRSQGQLTPEQMQQLRQQLQGQSGQGGFGGFAGRGGLTGTVDKVEGNTVTITTAQGPLQATLSADTTIQKTTVGTVADLTPGLRVTVVSQRGTDGAVTARFIVITPEGVNLFGGGLQ